MTYLTTIKAVLGGDDWLVDVLAAPFGSPTKKDAHGEWFSPRTNVREDWFPTPAVLYYHGYTAPNAQQGTPEPIGSVVSRSVKTDGVWFRVALSKASAYAKSVWAAAQAGTAAASPGTIGHLIRKAKDGELLHWPIAEISLFDTAGGKRPASSYALTVPATKARYPFLLETLIMPNEDTLPVDASDAKTIEDAVAEAFAAGRKSVEETQQSDVQKLIQRELDKQMQHVAQTKAQQEAHAKLIKDAEEAGEARARATYAEEIRQLRRLPGGSLDYGTFGASPYAAKFAELRPYDNVDAADLALAVSVLQEGKRTGCSRYGASSSAYKALVVKLAEGRDAPEAAGLHALKMAGAPMPDAAALKANELMRNDYTGYGDEWVALTYSTMLWDKIRAGTGILNRVKQVEIPQGVESMTIPVAGSGFTFYKVTGAADTGTSGWPDATVAASKAGTSNKSLSAVKMGARAVWNGELEEDSVIPFASWIRESLQTDGAEHLESLIIDGHTTVTNQTNINDIAGEPGGTEYWLLFNGMRYVALLGASGANARSAGLLDDSDFLETVKLMGEGGLNALDRSKVGFIIDINTNWKALTLPELKTRDVNSNPTIENGQLTSIYGYSVTTSAHMHKASANRKANSAGKIDLDTAGNNLYGSILGVRWDQWVFGWKRKMVPEITRIARADAYEIVAHMRCDLEYRDDEAAAISYGVSL